MKLCVMCQSFEVRTGEPGYSELTPGYDAVIECGNYSKEASKHRWTMDNMHDYTGEFREKLKRAETCPCYEEVKP